MKDGKVLWCGEGGFILTDDTYLAERCRAFRTHWQTPPQGQPPMTELGHNYRLAEPLAVIARANLARFDDLAARRLKQADRLVDQLRGTPGITPPIVRDDEQPNGYAGLLRLHLPRPREFSGHVAQLGVANSVGSFGLVACDRRPPFAAYAPAACPQAAHVIEHTLAVVLHDHDDDQTIDAFARIIDEEARRWTSDHA